MHKTVFLDRDGVINKKVEGYVTTIEEFQMLSDVPEAIKILKQKKFKVIVITNQSAINRGFLTHQKLEEIHRFMKKQLLENSTQIDAIYYCPHKPEENCNCRKPKPGMLNEVIKKFDIDIKNSWFIGDSESDIEAAKEVGIKSIKIQTNSSILEIVKKISS
jgi:D-glycero-D-manno-heptose 1,7-bisphosphate phosphatase